VLRSGICLAAATCAFLAAPAAWAESLPEALAKAYQTNPALNAERARQRATDENVPQALAGYRPQIVASLSAGLQSVRDLLPGNTIQSANLKPWQIGVTVTQVLFNGFKTANSVRVAELQVSSGREALRNTGQGILLDAVTVYTNVLANQSLVEAQRANVAFLRETQSIVQKRLNAGDVTPTDVAQSEARLNRGIAGGHPVGGTVPAGCAVTVKSTECGPLTPTLPRVRLSVPLLVTVNVRTMVPLAAATLPKSVRSARLGALSPLVMLRVLPLSVLLMTLLLPLSTLIVPTVSFAGTLCPDPFRPMLSATPPPAISVR
jgi:hypothetical protein